MSERRITHPGLARAILLSLGLMQTSNGIYALFWPRGWYDDFPAGRGWVAAYPHYSEHLVRDIGGLFIGTGVLLLLAGAWLTRRVVFAAVVSSLLFAVAHATYHVSDFRGNDQAINITVLLAAVALSVVVLVLLALPPQVPHRHDRGEARIPLIDKPKGLMPRLFFRATRLRSGTVLDPIRAYAHVPMLMTGYGALEVATERSHHCDERVTNLAVIRAAMLTGCEWCLDFGSALLLSKGVPENDLRELALHRTSPRFSELDRLVLDYATAMTRTPVEVSDELVAQLREHLDDKAIVELTHHIALENYRARFNWALGLGSQDFSEGAYCVRPELPTPVPSG